MSKLRFVAISAAALAAALPALAAVPNYSIRLEKLNADSLKAKPACEKFAQRYAELTRDSALDEAGIKIPGTARELGQLVALARGYPGSSPSLTEARGVLDSALTLPNPEVSPKSLQFYQCRPMAYFDLYRSIIAGARKFGLADEKKQQIGRLFYAQAAQELDRFPVVVDLLFYESLSRRLVSAGFVEVSDPLFVALSDVEVKTNELRSLVRARVHVAEYPAGNWRWRDLSESQLNAVRSSFFFEYAESRPLAASLKSLFERLAKSSG